MANKKKNKMFQLKKSKIKSICEDHEFRNNVSVKEDGRAYETFYGDLKQTLVRYVILDFNSSLVKHLITLYENPTLIKNMKKDENIRKELESSFVTYDENDKLIMNESLKDDLTHWCLCIDAEDLYLYLYKEGLPGGYYNSELIKQHCPEVIQELLDDKILKCINVPEELSE